MGRFDARLQTGASTNAFGKSRRYEFRTLAPIKSFQAHSTVRIPEDESDTRTFACFYKKHELMLTLYPFDILLINGERSRLQHKDVTRRYIVFCAQLVESGIALSKTSNVYKLCPNIYHKSWRRSRKRMASSGPKIKDVYKVRRANVRDRTADEALTIYQFRMAEKDLEQLQRAVVFMFWRYYTIFYEYD
jgi:hypothetical protein